MSDPILIGYFPKRRAKPPDWLKGAPNVEQVCTASTCCGMDPEVDWINLWQHNDMWLYDSPELAWSILSEEEKPEFEVHAYRILPMVFDKGQQQPFQVPPLNVQPLPASYERLGYDVVSRLTGNQFDCSPLSCNSLAERMPVNRYCLVDSIETAFKLVTEFESTNCEPGPYYIVEVWRQTIQPSII